MAGLTRERLKERVRARRLGPVSPCTGAEGGAAANAEEAGPAGRWGVPLSGPGVAVDELLPGEAVASDFGVCYVMTPDARSVCEWADGVARRLGDLWISPPRALQPLGEDERIAFLDIETAGLSGMPTFLVGVMCWERGALSITQLLARDYPEEGALIHQTVEALRGSRFLFTYNGATFDIPYLRDRAIYHGVEFGVDAEHLDLLKPARRRFRDQFENCKLQTLECMLCGRDRGEDIPGHQIPEVYQQFVQSQDARLLEPIVRHNAIDLLTLAEILPHCLGEEGDGNDSSGQCP